MRAIREKLAMTRTLQLSSAIMALALGALIVSPLACSAAARGASAPGRFGWQQIEHLKWASNVQLSPDGTQIAFVRTAFDIMHDRRDQSVWVVNSDGGNVERISKPNMQASEPRWSPHGQRLLFVASAAKTEAQGNRDASAAGQKKNKKWQLQLHAMAADTTETVATLEHKPNELAWSPDGRQVAFAAFVPVKTGSVANMPAKPEGAKWGNKPVMQIDKLVFRFNGKGYLPNGHVQLFVVAATANSTPKQVTHGDRDNGAGGFGGEGLVWSRDGKSLIFSANRHAKPAYHPRRSNLYEVPIAGGAPRALTAGKGPHSAPVVSPNGEEIAYTGYQDEGAGFHQNAHLYVIDRDGAGRRLVMHDFPRSVSDPQWGANGRGLYFQYVDQGIPKLGYVTMDGKMTEVANIAGGGIDRPYSGGQYSLSPSTGAFAFIASGPKRPPHVAYGRRSADGAKIQQLTHPNRKLFANIELGSLATIHFKSSYDDRTIEGWVMRPPGFNSAKKYPLVLEIHGGPSLSYGPVFSTEDQVYAALGYIVLYVNPRGSTSYGPQFADLINNDYPDHDYNDLMSGVDAMIRRGHVDPKRLYVTGGSGGGVLTAWTVGHTHRFRAAVVAKPVINWYSWVLTADMGYIGMKYWMEGYPWDNLQHYMARSPISYVGNVKTPTMIIHGEVDYRTPAASAIQFYTALKMLRVPAMLVRIPGASHEIAEKPRNLIAKLANITGWFACYGGQSVGDQTCPYAANGQAPKRGADPGNQGRH